MNKILFICGFVLISIRLFGTEYCGGICNVNLHPITNEPIDEFKCTIPSMPTMKVVTSDAFDDNGALKYYWDGKTVCDVLGWLKYRNIGVR